MRKINELDRFELRVYNAVKQISNEKAEDGSSKKATRGAVGKMLRVRDDPHSHKSRSVLVRLAHQGFLKMHGSRRASFYTVAKAKE